MAFQLLLVFHSEFTTLISCPIIGEYYRELVEFNLKFICGNIGKIYAQYVNGVIFVPDAMVSDEVEELSSLALGSIKTIEERQYREVHFSNIHKDLVDFKLGMPAYGGFSRVPHTYRYVTRYNPVLPSLGFVSYINLKIKKDAIPTFENDVLRWQIHADNMPTEKGEIKLKDLEFESIIVPDLFE